MTPQRGCNGLIVLYVVAHACGILQSVLRDKEERTDVQKVKLIDTLRCNLSHRILFSRFHRRQHTRGGDGHK